MLVTQTYLPGLISGEVVDETWSNRLLRVILGVSVTAVWIILIKLVEKADLTNPYILMIFEQLLPKTIMGLSFFFVADLLSRQLGLLKIEKCKNQETVEKDKMAAREDGDDDREALLLESN